MTEQERLNTSEQAWQIVQSLLNKTPAELEREKIREIIVLIPPPTDTEVTFDQERGSFKFDHRILPELQDKYRKERVVMNLQENPNSGDLWFSLAAEYHKEEQIDRGIACLQRVVEIDPQDQNAWHNLGESYFNLKQDMVKAKESWIRALEIKPDDHEDWHNLALSNEVDSNTQEAIRCYDQAIQHNPHYVPSIFNLGMLYFYSGNIEKAKQLIKKACEINPEVRERVQFESLLS